MVVLQSIWKGVQLSVHCTVLCRECAKYGGKKHSNIQFTVCYNVYIVLYTIIHIVLYILIYIDVKVAGKTGFFSKLN